MDAGLLLDVFAFGLHLLLLPVAFVLSEAVAAGVAALREGRPLEVPASPGRLLRDLRWQLGKQRLRAEPGAGWHRLGLETAAVLPVLALLLLPSFATGLPTAALSDLPSLLLMLGLSRSMLIVLAADEGGGRSGLSALRGLAGLLLAVPGALLCAASLLLSTGAMTLDGVIAAGRSLPDETASLALAAAALAASGLAAGSGTHLAERFSGLDRTLASLALGTQRLCWLSIVASLAMPCAVATVSAPAWWLPAALSWLGAIALLSGGAALLAPRGSRPSDPSRLLAATSLLLAILSPLFGAGGGR
ncbi:hypothetical protein [Rhizosaccharibacter radicis]|uniref:Formate hydrogenlyase subunit 4 n=1 Tax=Rhizosaccharibacter radicis TaxID=2782605 RepID=A0ABT1VZB3_9PROT|nr:hypothetical protein [Acetobacteraceae bacterium KSS12]